MLPDSSDRLVAAEGASEPGRDAPSPPHALDPPASGTRTGPWRPDDVLAELHRHARGDDLARLVHAVAFAAADERRTTFADGLGEVAERVGLRHEDAETSFGNVLRALERSDAGPAGSASPALLSGALAR